MDRVCGQCRRREDGAWRGGEQLVDGRHMGPECGVEGRHDASRLLSRCCCCCFDLVSMCDVCRWMDAAAVEREREREPEYGCGGARSEQKRVCARRAATFAEAGHQRLASSGFAIILMPFSSQRTLPRKGLKTSSGAEPRDVEQPSLFLFESRVQHLPRSFRPFSAAWEAAQHEAAAPGRRSGHSFDFSSLAV